MIKVTQHGDFKNIELYLKKHKDTSWVKLKMLDKYAQEGLEALKEATPRRTGKTANSWSYGIEQTKDKIIIHYDNSNLSEDWCNIAVIVDIGHATKGGGWIEGKHYISPAVLPVFNKIITEICEEVSD